jgi:uncharacterized protein
LRTIARVTALVAGWLLIVWIAVEPALGAWNYRRLKRTLARRPDARPRFYRRTLAIQWAWTLVVAAYAAPRPSPWRALGLAVGPPAFSSLLARSLVVAAPLLVLAALMAPFLSASGRQQIAGALDPIRDLLPRGPVERRWFALVAISAGVCEELLYRGFFLWWLDERAGLWVAIVVSSFAFGFAHVYQGVRGIVGTSVLGALMALVYVGTGSLWPAIAFHALVDLRVLILARIAERAPA